MTREAQLVEGECEWAAVDTSNDSVTVFSGPCIYYGHVVTTVLSAHVVLIKDNTTTISSLVASSAVGLPQMLPVGIRCNTSLVVDPDNSSTGNILVFFRRLQNAT